MSISADTLLDRMYLKAQLTKWRIAAIALFVFIVVSLLGGLHKSAAPLGENYIARVSIDSVILDDRKFYELLDDVADNKRARAVILWIDSPGGAAVAGEEIYLRLKRLAAKKPVVAVMRSVAASAGYMVALGTDRIYAREGTITGSIGVIIEAAEVTELAQKLGVKPLIVKSSELKSTLSPFEKASPESLQVVQTMIDDFYNRFVDMVAAARKLPREEVIKLADGSVYSGRRAADLKLVDAIGGEEDAVAWLEAEKKIPKGLEIIDESVKKPMNFMEQLAESSFGGVFGKFFQNSRIKLDGLSAIWHPDLY